jgi:hypothetical protein
MWRGLGAARSVCNETQSCGYAALNLINLNKTGNKVPIRPSPPRRAGWPC